MAATGEQPSVECPRCQEEFPGRLATRRNLHLLTHNLQLVWVCLGCSQEYQAGRYYDLSRHAEKRHPLLAVFHQASFRELRETDEGPRGGPHPLRMRHTSRHAADTADRRTVVSGDTSRGSSTSSESEGKRRDKRPRDSSGKCDRRPHHSRKRSGKAAASSPRPPPSAALGRAPSPTPASCPSPRGNQPASDQQASGTTSPAPFPAVPWAPSPGSARTDGEAAAAEPDVFPLITFGDGLDLAGAQPAMDMPFDLEVPPPTPGGWMSFSEGEEEEEDAAEEKEEPGSSAPAAAEAPAPETTEADSPPQSPAAPTTATIATQTEGSVVIVTGGTVEVLVRHQLPSPPKPEE